MREYQWVPPRFKVGDRVYGRASETLWISGKVTAVHTHYTDDLVAYHTYAVLFNDWQRHRWLGEKDVSP
jgi:hypothetical protein